LLVPQKLPNAQDGPEAGMQAINEWFTYQDHLELTKATTHPNKPANNAIANLRLPSETGHPSILKSHKEIHDTADRSLHKMTTSTKHPPQANPSQQNDEWLPNNSMDTIDLIVRIGQLAEDN